MGQFNEDGKPILKLVEEDSMALVRITPGATVSSSAETKPEEEKNEGDQIVDYQNRKKHWNLARNTDMIGAESD